jgi:hypothetical protein
MKNTILTNKRREGKRTKYIGARFTEREKALIEHFADKRDFTLSELIRQALFSHINFLKQFNNQDSDHSTNKYLMFKLGGKK